MKVWLIRNGWVLHVEVVETPPGYAWPQGRLWCPQLADWIAEGTYYQDGEQAYAIALAMAREAADAAAGQVEQLLRERSKLEKKR